MLLGVWRGEITMVILPESLGCQSEPESGKTPKELQAVEAPPLPVQKASKTPCLVLRCKTKPRARRFRFAKYLES